jgi:hypothetical protein
MAKPTGVLGDEDAAKAKTYHACADVVIWTPGANSGNPISLNLLPDFASIDDADQRDQAVDMAWTTLTPFLAGGGVRANRMKGVLAGAIRRFAAGGGSKLADLIALLADLPDGVSQDSNAERLASEIADQLHAAVAMNPLLQSVAEPLDPKTLFEVLRGKTRVSVINLAGLASNEARDSFVNRLQMSLFTFIKRNPSSTGRLYVIDEAQNFVPSGAGTACKASAQSGGSGAQIWPGMMFARRRQRASTTSCRAATSRVQPHGLVGDDRRNPRHDGRGTADDIGGSPRASSIFRPWQTAHSSANAVMPQLAPSNPQRLKSFRRRALSQVVHHRIGLSGDGSRCDCQRCCFGNRVMREFIRPRAVGDT